MFNSEVELCAKFIENAKSQGWRCYQEFANFDLYIVKEDVHIGIEAKLQANFKVIMQAKDKIDNSHGPDFVAVLVPKQKAKYEFRVVFNCAGMIVFDEESDIATMVDFGCLFNNPKTRPTLPLVEETGAIAGSSAPVKLTRWKINIINLLAINEVQGFITTKNMKECGINRGTIVSRLRWFVAGSNKGEYVKTSIMEYRDDLDCFTIKNKALFAASIERERKKHEQNTKK